MSIFAYTLYDITRILGQAPPAAQPPVIIEELCYDSRIILSGKNALFFALTQYRDGHTYLDDAYQKGIRYFVVQQQASFKVYDDAYYIRVPDTLKALQDLAQYHRHRFNIPILGLTGSNGKTIIKEWLNQLLSVDMLLVRSPKSFNSQIGLPLSLWQLNENHRLGLFEVGISRQGEMQALAEVLHPTIGVLTHMGSAHAEGFKDKQQKLEEKLQLFKYADLIIADAAHREAIGSQLPQAKTFLWSFTQPCDLQVLNTLPADFGTDVQILYQSKQYQLQIPFTDTASIENALICLATMLALDYDITLCLMRLRHLSALSMRLALKAGVNNCTIIDDSYSADSSSLKIALDFLQQQNQHQHKTLILSDLDEVGLNVEELYTKVAHLLHTHQITRLIGVGQGIAQHAEKFKMEKCFFEDTETLIHQFNELKFKEESILIKGKRRFNLERVSKLLSQKMHDTVLEVHLNALQANLQFYSTQLNEGVKVMAMVKAFAYGSGSFEIAKLLQFHKVDYLAVAYADEGVALRKQGIHLPILVMSPEEVAFEAMIAYDLEPEIYSMEVLQNFTKALNKRSDAYPIHLKIDTGMHRLGFDNGEIPALCAYLKTAKHLKVRSVFSHLAGSDSPELDEFTRMQIARFNDAYRNILSVLEYRPIKHILNTSGITRFKAAQYDMVRVGIGLYGFDYALPRNTLQTVMSLKTSVTQVKVIAPGETVGYGRKGLFNNGGKIATVKIGYADGYPRAFGNGRGKMMLHNHIVPVIGQVCMDMCMLDVSGIPVEAGDEVIVFNEDLSIEFLAKAIGTIPYEILTNISQRVKRVYYYE